MVFPSKWQIGRVTRTDGFKVLPRSKSVVNRSAKHRESVRKREQFARGSIAEVRFIVAEPISSGSAHHRLMGWFNLMTAEVCIWTSGVDLSLD